MRDGEGAGSPGSTFLSRDALSGLSAGPSGSGTGSRLSRGEGSPSKVLVAQSCLTLRSRGL